MLFLQFCIIERSNITHGNRQFLSLIAQLPVLGISHFLPGEQARILSVQLFYLRKFLYPQFIKGLFGCLVQRQFFTVRFEVLRLSCKDSVYIAADDAADGFPLRINRPFLTLGVRRRRNDGKPVLQADEIADFLKSKPGPPEITEFL